LFNSLTMLKSCFNPRPRTGGDPLFNSLTMLKSCFNPRPRTGGDIDTASTTNVAVGFNPRPRTGGDDLQWGLFPDPLVSIHAPARGATRRNSFAVIPYQFQSTPPHGGRRKTVYSFLYIVHVSIHAPARGRQLRAELADMRAEFQSTPPHGGRLDGSPFVVIILLFQSTPPHGGRLIKAIPECPAHGVSIHAPARGATSLRACHKRNKLVSIHAPARGATKDFLCIPVVYTVSIHAPARGATFFSWQIWRGCCCFNPRPRTGGDSMI